MVFKWRGSERLTSCRFGGVFEGFVGIKNAREDTCGRIWQLGFCYLLESLEFDLTFVASTFLFLLVTTSSRSCSMVTERCFFSSGKT